MEVSDQTNSLKHPVADLSIQRRLDYLTATAGGSSYELTIPKYNPNSPQYFTWIGWDLGQCVLALVKHYNDESADILGETFYAVGDKMNYTEYASVIQKRSVTFSTIVDIWCLHSACSYRQARSLCDRRSCWNGGEALGFALSSSMIVHIY